jgi:DNA polymerase-3 subunit alpha
VYLILDESQRLINEDFEFIPQLDIELEEGMEGYVYEFGGRWYTQAYGEDISLKELRYVGRAQQKMPSKTFLGIHSGYELMNGIGLYKDWVKKAKFLGIETLAICEKKTLAGALEFQSECKKNNIKSIIGLTIPVEDFDVKLYAQNFQGWLNLLYFNSKLNIEKEQSIKMMDLSKNSEGLFVVADPKTMPFAMVEDCIHFYQLDTVNFLNEEKDSWYLGNLEKFIKSDLQPISITDAYYLEKEDYLTRESLWTIAKAYDDKTNNQYFKSKEQYAKELINMFDPADKSWIKLFQTAVANEQILADGCSFEYDTDTRHLPQYIMNPWEAEQFATNEELFLNLIKKGFKEKNIVDPQKYIDRLKTEIAVLKQGDVIDYFLSLYDIIQFAKRENMLTGIGRGSAGGSLVAYLLGIIQIDPLEFDLLFERFLNSGRMGEYQDRPSYDIELEDGSTITLAEGALVRVMRNEKETIVFVHDLQEGDQYLKH